MVIRSHVPVLFSAAALFATNLARAEDNARSRAPAIATTPAAEPAPSPTASAGVVRRLPAVHHAPVTVGSAHEPISILADITDADLVRHAFVVYRNAKSVNSATSELATVELLRTSGEARYRADIPARDVLAPFVDYTIEFERQDGTRMSAFASRGAMHRVAVATDYLDLREQALLSRVHGRRSVSEVRFDYASFGTSRAFTADTGFRSIQDRFYRVEAAYTFRPLRVVTEFTVKLGVLRGTSPAPSANTPGDLDVGLNYTAPSVRLRLVDWLHVDLEGLTSLTEKGFELGGAAQFVVGDPYGSKVLAGAQSLHGFGSRFWSRVDIPAGSRLVLSPIVEATNWPHADQYGVRLLFEIAVDLSSGLGATLGGGYQARESTSGGPSAAVGVRYTF
jgi:hypothetical protein